jgi:hypothetical protein
MAYSPHPITVDGASLNLFAWNIDTKVRPWPTVRSGDVVVPGVDGVVASLNDDIDVGLLTLSMWLVGTDSSGTIPGGSTAMSECRKNLDSLSFLFGRRNALLDIREVVDTPGTIKQAWGKVVEAVAPDIKAGGLGRYSINIELPDGMWQDPTTADWSQASAVSGTQYTVTTLAGATGPVSDATVLVTGPATNPRVTDVTTGAYVQLNLALPAGQAWRVNCATWTTRYGAGLTLGSADTAGTDAQAVTVFGGGNARFLRLQPALVLTAVGSDFTVGTPVVKLTLTGTSFTSATAVAVRARRKFLQ